MILLLVLLSAFAFACFWMGVECEKAKHFTDKALRDVNRR